MMFDVIVCQAAHDSWVRGVLFHPTALYVISVAEDKSMRVTDAVNGK